jgi:sugar phosphate isomerase/epimerase
VVAKRRFGVSTRLYEGQRLKREHLLEIASFGFETVELHGVPTHFDASNDAVVADLQQWLAEARLDLQGLRVPGSTTTSAAGGLDAADEALFVARRIPYRALTLQVVRPREAAKTIERLGELAEPLGVVIAIDSTSEGLSPIGSLVHFVEGFDARVGVALDFAKASRDGDLVEAIEVASEHLMSIRLPAVESGVGRIDWPSALTAVQKVGYEGPVLLEPSEARLRAAPKAALAQARQARERVEKLLCTFI